MLSSFARLFSGSGSHPPVRSSYGADPLQFGELRLPAGDGATPVAIVVHGGFWLNAYDLSLMTPMCAALAAAGIATWNVEYRRIGDPGGGWPGTLQDVALAADYLRDLALGYNLDLNHVITIGHSAGGHLALWLAARGRIPASDPLYSPNPLPIRGAIPLAAVTDLKRGWEMQLGGGVVSKFMGGTPDEFPERYASASPAEMLPLGVPQILIHGARDDVVPLKISEEYQTAAAARGDNATRVALPEAGHFEVIDPESPEWSSVMGAVLKLI